MEKKYLEIALSMEQRIHEGDWKNATKLPTEDELISIYNVSRNTIRKAVTILVRRGILMSIQGSGVFIRNVAKDGYINLEDFYGLTQGFRSHSITSSLIKLEQTKADERVAALLKCKAGTPIYYIERVRLLDGRPFVLEYSYFNKKIIPYLNEEIVLQSIYGYIINDLEKSIGYVDRVITAGKLNKEQASLLHLEDGDPALISSNTAMLSSGVVFDYSIDVHHYKESKFLKISNFT
jgi:GntR family transcriptional regulator of bglA